MFKTGIIDQVKFQEWPQENVHQYGLLLTTEVGITDKPEEKTEPTPPMNRE